jgi:hypothetical protein
MARLGRVLDLEHPKSYLFGRPGKGAGRIMPQNSL